MLDQGIERKTIMNALEGYSCPVDAAFLKEAWRSIQFTQTGKLSTTALTTDEVDKVYDTFNRFLSESFGIHIPFPSFDALMLADLDNSNFQ